MKNRAAAYIGVMMLALSCLGGGYSAAKKNREGNESYRKGRYDQALKSYSEALTEAPEKRELYFNIGDVLYKQSKFDDAAKLYEKSATADVDHQSKILYNMGNAKFRMRKEPADVKPLKEAAALYVKSLELNPADRDAKYNLEFVLREIRKIEEKKKDKKEEPEEKPPEREIRDAPDLE